MSACSIVTLLLTVVIAQHAPVGEPSGNVFSRPLNENVPSCRPFTVAWQPTTLNNISLVLLKGPAENVTPIETLATGVANSGSFVWTPSDSLEATSTAKYGLQLIDDLTGQYQYSTQFGLSKGPECASYSSSVIASPTGIQSATSRPSSNPTDKTSGRHLSPGESAAIALGAIVGAAILAGMLWFAYSRYKVRKARRLESEPKSELTGGDEVRAELQHDDVRELDGKLMTELASKPISELASQPINELFSQPISELATPVAELEEKDVGNEKDGGSLRKDSDK